MLSFAALFFSLLPLQAAQAEDLLVNSSFEQLTVDGKPKGWDLFVMPMQGALGRASAQAQSGKRSILLVNAEAYPDDPANNWSQVVYGDFGGKRLRAEAAVRVENATEAALWIQCFRSNPIRTLAAATSTTDEPVYGTADWERISVSVDAPKDTSFVVVRCVIRGAGRVWFDNLQLSENPDSPAPEDLGIFEPKNPAPDEAPDPALAEFEQLRGQMQDALDALRASNETLQNQIQSLQTDLERFESRLRETHGGTELPELLPPEPERIQGDRAATRRHILIPRTGGF